MKQGVTLQYQFCCKFDITRSAFKLFGGMHSYMIKHPGFSCRRIRTGFTAKLLVSMQAVHVIQVVMIHSKVFVTAPTSIWSCLRVQCFDMRIQIFSLHGQKDTLRTLNIWCASHSFLLGGDIQMLQVTHITVFMCRGTNVNWIFSC